MPKTKFEILLAVLLLAIVTGLGWWLFFGPTPKQQFLREVEKTLATVNDGGHLKVQEKFSPEFLSFLSQQGAEPQQLLLACRQIDINQNAHYSLRQLTIYEEKSFAEIEFLRKTADDGHVFTLPFIYRNGRWWITDHFKSDKSFEAIPGL